MGCEFHNVSIVYAILLEHIVLMFYFYVFIV